MVYVGVVYSVKAGETAPSNFKNFHAFTQNPGPTVSMPGRASGPPFFILAMTLFLLVLPVIILWVLVKILPPWVDGEKGAPSEAA